MSELSDEDDVICPYCLCSSQTDPHDFDEHEREEECFCCGETFILRDEMTITHYTKKKP